jgi:hypothetical protein
MMWCVNLDMVMCCVDELVSMNFMCCMMCYVNFMCCMMCYVNLNVVMCYVNLNVVMCYVQN